MSPPALALFDCDGTLLDGQHAVIEAMGAAWKRHGLGPIDPEAVRGIIGLNLHEGIAQLVPDRAADRVDDLVTAYRDAYVALRRERGTLDVMYEGMDDVLQTLGSRGVLLGVATGKSRRGLDAALAAHGLAERFVTLHTSDSVAHGKPHPQMVLEAMAETGAPADRTVMIGDTRFDMQMADAAGVGAIGVAWGYHPPDSLRAAGAHVVVGEPARLLDAIVGRLGA